MQLRRAAPMCVALLLVLDTGFSLPRSAASALPSSPPQFCTEYGANPVLNSSGQYTAHSSGGNYTSFTTEYDYASVLRSSGIYQMWFSGLVNNVSGIFTASSPNGVNWTTRSNPVLTVGPNGAWDDGAVYSPDVIWNGTTYLMYYVGTGTNAFREIGLAFSKDNVNWQKYPQNPVLEYGPSYYDSWWTRFPSVILNNGTYKMWYTGHTLTNTSAAWYLAIDYATSSDGVHWTKYAGNPVFGGGPDWFSAPFYQHPSVSIVNNTYVMVGDDGVRISYATSPDGVHWTSNNQTLVGPSSFSSGNGSALYPTVLVDGTRLLIWYTGESIARYQGYNLGIDLAYCGLLPISTTVSVTTTSTTTAFSPSTTTFVSTSETTVTLTSETTVTSTTTERAEPPASLMAFEIATVVLGALLVVAILLLLERNRPPRKSRPANLEIWQGQKQLPRSWPGTSSK